MWKVQWILHDSRFEPPRAASDRGRTTGWTAPSFGDALMPACVMRRRYRQAPRFATRNSRVRPGAMRSEREHSGPSARPRRITRDRRANRSASRCKQPIVRISDWAGSRYSACQAAFLESPLPASRWRARAEHPNCVILRSPKALGWAEADEWTASRTGARCCQQ